MSAIEALEREHQDTRKQHLGHKRPPYTAALRPCRSHTACQMHRRHSHCLCIIGYHMLFIMRVQVLEQSRAWQQHVLLRRESRGSPSVTCYGPTVSTLLSTLKSSDGCNVSIDMPQRAPQLPQGLPSSEPSSSTRATFMQLQKNDTSDLQSASSALMY
jgi:hypothetical protein